MMIKFPRPRFRLPAALIILLIALVAHAAAQTRDNLTDAESELIRFHRELDKRVEVLIKAADRRFAVINGTKPPSTKKSFSDEPDWGELPQGTRAQLLNDVAGILDEAITNVDDVARRDPRSPLLGKSLKKLTAAINGYLSQLEVIRSKTPAAEELEAMGRIGEQAKQILDAASQHPALSGETPEKKRKP
jgi:hypothetical protein